MRISDWSSDVCSSDLPPLEPPRALMWTSSRQSRARTAHTPARSCPQRRYSQQTHVSPHHRPSQPGSKRQHFASRCPQIAPRHNREPLPAPDSGRSEEHTPELQSLMRISNAVFCLKQKKKNIKTEKHIKKI